MQRGAPRADRVVLFVHGAGTPAEVAFDVPYRRLQLDGLSRAAGFDVFSMDMTGYGRSTRPAPMNDPCNLSAEQQTAFVPADPAPCKPTYPRQLTTIASDWNDIDAVVDTSARYATCERVSLVGVVARRPARRRLRARSIPTRSHKLVLLAPAYRRDARPAAAATVPAHGVPSTRSRMPSSWRTGIARSAARTSTSRLLPRQSSGRDMLESDPVGATWGQACAVRRTRPRGGGTRRRSGACRRRR